MHDHDEDFRASIRDLAIKAFVAVVFAIAAGRYVWLGRWQANFKFIAFAFFGFMAIVASEHVAGFTGSYGWTRSQWRQYPEWFVKLLGVGALGWGTFQLCAAG
jgi:hypothetical protein